MVSNDHHMLTEGDALAIATLENKKELARLSAVDSDDAITHLIAIGAPVNGTTIAQASECILHARVEAQHHLIKLNDTRLGSPVALNSARPRSFKTKRNKSTDRYKDLYDRNIPCQFIMFDERRFNDVFDDIVDQIYAERIWINNIWQRRRIAQIFGWITGNKQLGAYNHLDVELFKSGYQKFPIKYLWGNNRSGALSRPFADVVASIGTLKPEERRSASTVNTALSYLSTIAKLLAKTAWHPKIPNTTVLDFSAARVSRREDGVDPRPPWTRSHMETLFSSPVYIGGGYGKERFAPTENPIVFHDAAYYAPLFWYYLQACRDEICGLSVDDIFSEGKIPYFIIRNNLIRGYEGGMSGEKRAARRRALPIHPEILRLGFLEYVKSIRDEGHRALFPELYTNPTKRGGHHFYEVAWYHIFTWIYSHNNVPISPKGKMSDIHSIRSLGSSFYELDGVNEIIRSDIMGHARPGVNGKHYSKRISTEGIDTVISERLDFILKYIPNITADVRAHPINLLPLNLRSRLGVRTVRKIIT